MSPSTAPVSLRRVLIAASIVAVAGVGLLVAATATRQQQVELTTHIEICEQGESGWQVIDEVGPLTVRFQASLLELASGRTVESNYVFKTTSKKGLPYSARLLGPGKLDLHPMSGRMVGNLVLEVSYGEETARVPARLTTESTSGPLGTRRGRAAEGTLGLERTSMTMVSANTFARKGARPLTLICTETYSLTPAGATADSGAGRRR